MKRLLILSGKGGTGKTTTAAAFTKFANAKAIADCDVDAPNLHIVSNINVEPTHSDFFGSDKAVIDSSKCIGCGICEKHCRFNALEKVGDVCKINEYSCEGCGVCVHMCPQKAISMEKDIAGEQSLYVDDTVFSTAKLKMGRGNSGKLVTAVKLALFKNAPECELAIIDGSPGIGCPVIASISGVDLVLVVAEPSLSGISDLERLLKTTESFQTNIAVCVNKWDASPENTEKIKNFCSENNILFVGKVPYDKNASVAINSGKSLAEIDCPATKALKEIFNETMKIMDVNIL